MADARIVGGSPAGGAYGVAGTQAIVTPQAQALKILPTYDDYVYNGRVLGHYKAAFVSGLTTGLAATNLLASFRYVDTSASTMALMKRIAFMAAPTTAFTTAQAVDCDVIHVRNWVSVDTAGTALAPFAAANSQKSRTNMGNSLLSQAGDLRVATTAAIGAGATKTPDSLAFGAGGSFSTSPAAMTDLYKLDKTGDHPILYANQEGFNGRLITAQGAAGVVKYYFIVEWAEVASF